MRKQIGKYEISVIRRTWHTYECEMSGDETAVFENKKLVYVTDGDWSNKTEQEIESEIT